MTIADCLFLSRAMGAPVPAGMAADKIVAWTAAASSNPEKRARASAHIETLLGMLPTEEDAARTPVESVRPPSLASRPLRGEPCPCESHRWFEDCHGAESS